MVLYFLGRMGGGPCETKSTWHVLATILCGCLHFGAFHFDLFFFATG